MAWALSLNPTSIATLSTDGNDLFSTALAKFTDSYGCLIRTSYDGSISDAFRLNLLTGSISSGSELETSQSQNPFCINFITGIVLVGWGDGSNSFTKAVIASASPPTVGANNNHTPGEYGAMLLIPMTSSTVVAISDQNPQINCAWYDVDTGAHTLTYTDDEPTTFNEDCAGADKLTTTTVLIISADEGSNCKTSIGEITGGTVSQTAGTTLTGIAPTGIGPNCSATVQLTTNKLLFVYVDTDDGHFKATILTVSGTTVSNTSPVTLYNNASTYFVNFNLLDLGNGTYAVVHGDVDDIGTHKLGLLTFSVSGSTITNNDDDVDLSGSGNYGYGGNSAVAIDSTTIGIVAEYYDSVGGEGGPEHTAYYMTVTQASAGQFAIFYWGKNNTANQSEVQS